MRAPIVIFLTTSALLAQFRSTSTLVIAPTTVTDPAGKFIDGLQPEHLILYDNNVPQPIQVDEAIYPISLVVAVETSQKSQAVLDKLANGNPLDPETYARIRKRADRIREEVFQKHGLLDIAVPAIRELRDE